MHTLSFGGRPMSSVAKVEAGARSQPAMLPRPTKALLVRLARENALPMTLIVSAALLAFSKKTSAQRRAECLSLLGVPPGTFRR